ncbi:glutamine--tRNA ligase/YqeY domain fusion protein [Candidatus Annandia pinicola]|uniref:glutamine--tRNA ligase/YqeY domain fusion protein n=1 Tax=Candidatus Annandia pinicola TaxID=1345117 RepID=UPI001D0290E4|nr:glutamine--tRNA ligase/YqeY domain fusion protein [Candidatus Annandia pinicola]UDG80344.1 Glutamine--tRNA ligase [Candidatus Annandia pinicola]
MNKTKNNFIYNIITKDLKKCKHKKIYTRFPPEPNGYLHIGHAKSILLNFNIAKKFNGICNLRLDDTNPSKENKKYVNSIKYDIKWLGFKFYYDIYYTSQYFYLLYKFSIKLIKNGLAYIDELNKHQISKYKGNFNNLGKNSPYRKRSINENLIFFKKMKNGFFNNGKISLRAKINMLSPNILMRDPILYRIKFNKHYKTKYIWCIYPMYDFAHCLSDYIEKITHSLCTLEFQDNKILYDWFLNNLKIFNKPKQYEFSRLNIEYNVISKRKLSILIKKKIITGWDDPRIVTLSGLRNRGYTSNSILNFCNSIGVTRQNSLIKISFLENFIRKELNIKSQRLIAVLNPIKIIIENFNKIKEKILIPNHPQNKNMGKRKYVFSKEIYIDNKDFKEKKTNGYRGLTIGNKVKLRYSYIIKAKKIKKDKNGNIIYILCKYYKNRKKNNVNGIIHWISKLYSIPAIFFLYYNLFKISNPENKKNFIKYINKKSLVINRGFIEKNIKNINNFSYQFERKGYFCLNKNFKNNNIFYFNRIVKLKNII